jgi:hypothetical protein
MKQTLAPRPLADGDVRTTSVKSEAYSSGVSWPAVIGGAFVAASLSLILLTLGTGLGLSSVSPCKRPTDRRWATDKCIQAWCFLFPFAT